MRPDSAEEKDDLELGMEQPSSQNENPNKAFEVIGAKARLNLNADVGSGIYWRPRAQWTFHHSETKVTNPAETIWKSEAKNSQ